MKFICSIFICSIVLLHAQDKTSNNSETSPLRRADSFFGIHYDFHASENDNKIGETFTFGMADSMLSYVKPDFIQIDCKGHPGISSYPTKIGNPAPGFVQDPYLIWHKATQKNGVSLFVHYSGVIDNEAVKKHPEWAAVDADGNISKTNTSVMGPYDDNLLIPQLKELISNYHINGAWVDGECWALDLDYSKYMVDAFKKKTGIRTVPLSDKDAGWFEFREFNRTAFKNHVAHYVNELHKYDPDFQITSNWIFSSLVPDPVNVNVDFISGDFSPDNSVYSGLYEARCIAPQGKPWDLMAWSFYNDGNTGVQITKSPVQLMQCAASVISMGGGFQLYFQQNRDASIKPWNFELMKQVADFCRARQPYCKGAKPVPQIAILYSSANFHKNSKPLYNNSSKVNNPIKGILNMLLDGHKAVEILMEHNLKDKIDEYPIVIVPECQYLEEEFKTSLLKYAENGGNLLIVGPDAVKLFADKLDVKLSGQAVEGIRNLSWNGQLAGIHSVFQPFIPANSKEVFGAIYKASDLRFPNEPAATISSYGKGKIAAVYFNMGQNYLQMSNPIYRDFFNALVSRLFVNPKVEIECKDDLAITVNRLNNDLEINLINISGPHANIHAARYDNIPPVEHINVKVKLDKEPAEVMLQPENISLKYNYSNGELTTTVDKVDIHSIIMIKEKK